MNDEKLYAILCGAISDALDHLPLKPENEKGRFLLENALALTEEYYIINPDDEIEAQNR